VVASIGEHAEELEQTGQYFRLRNAPAFDLFHHLVRGVQHLENGLVLIA
jgi:hypothetical protein